MLASAATACLLGGLLMLTHRQLLFWQNTVSLFAHNVAVTPDNGSAYFTLGLGYEHAGDTNRALVCYQTAENLSPADLQIRRCLASLYTQQGQLEAAEKECTGVLALQPDDSTAHAMLADLYSSQGRFEESITEMNSALRYTPDSAVLINNLAWMLATCQQKPLRDGARAITLAQRACEATKFQQTIYVGTLAAAYAEAGNFDQAIATAQKACSLAKKNDEADLFKRNQELLALYQQHQAYPEK
jgi:tetratricopeptide (TPR) repeat protein